MADEIKTEGQEQLSAEQEFLNDLKLVNQPEEQPEVTPEETKTGETAAPETKTEVAEPEKKETPAETGTDDDDLKDLPEDNPRPDHWKEMRKRYAELKKQVKNKPAETVHAETPAVSEALPTMPIADEPKAPATETKREYTPDQVLLAIARVEAGEIEDASVRKEAERYAVDKFTPQEIREMYLKAQNNGFGAYSESIENACAKLLPIVRENHETRERQTKAVEAAKVTRAKAWDEVFKVYKPETLKDKASPVYNDFQQANAELTEKFPGFWNLPNAPVLLKEHAEKLGKVRKAADYEKELALLKAENESLKKTNSAHSAPISTGGGQPKTTAKTAEDEARENFKALGLIQSQE